MSIYTTILSEYDDISLEEMLALPGKGGTTQATSEKKKNFFKWLGERLSSLWGKLIELIQNAIRYIKSIPQRIKDRLRSGEDARIVNEVNRYKEAYKDMKHEQAATKRREEDMKDRNTTVQVDGKDVDAVILGNKNLPQGDWKNGEKCLDALAKASMKVGTSGTMYEQTILQSAHNKNNNLESELALDLDDIEEACRDHADVYAKAEGFKSDCKTALYENDKLRIRLTQDLTKLEGQAKRTKAWYDKWLKENPDYLTQTMASRIASGNGKIISALGKTCTFITG